MEFVDSGQNFSIANISMKFLMRNKDNLNNCYSYPINGHLENTEGNYISTTNYIFHNMSKSNNRSEVPFMIPNTMNRKFENFSKLINKENNLVKESMEHWNQMSKGYSEFLTSSKGYTYVSNSIASYLIGGFVGSKSQMNNEKHHLSYDLGEAIFKILHDCKCDKSFEKGKEDKRLDIQKMTKKQPKLSLKDVSNGISAQELNMSSYKSNFISNNKKEMDCTIKYNLYQNNSNTISEMEVVKEDKQTCLKNVIVASVKPLQPNEMKSDKLNDIHKISDHENLCLKTSLHITSNVCELEHFNHNVTHATANNNHSTSSVICEVNDVKCCKDSVKPKIDESFQFDKPMSDTKLLNKSPSMSCLSAGNRARQYSQCSVESTDSESFIVFDEMCCDSSYEELQSHLSQESENESEEEDDDEEEDYCYFPDDDDDSCWIRNVDECDTAADDKEIIEANIRWSKLYRDVIIDDVTERQKKVQFKEKPEIHKMIAWDFAYRAARPGPWEQMVRDRGRFRERICRVSEIISPVLEEAHRKSIYEKLYA